MPKQTENFPWGRIANFIMRSGGLRPACVDITYLWLSGHRSEKVKRSDSGFYAADMCHSAVQQA